MSLDTLANVKLRLGVTTSTTTTLLSALMDSADQYVAEYCGRDFGGGTFTEYHPGDTRRRLPAELPGRFGDQRQGGPGLRLRGGNACGRRRRMSCTPIAA